MGGYLMAQWKPGVWFRLTRPLAPSSTLELLRLNFLVVPSGRVNIMCTGTSLRPPVCGGHSGVLAISSVQRACCVRRGLLPASEDRRDTFTLTDFDHLLTKQNPAHSFLAART